MRESSINHILSKTRFEVSQLNIIIEELTELGWDKARIYNELMSGYGVHKSHVSAKVDSMGLMSGGKNRARRKSRNHPG